MIEKPTFITSEQVEQANAMLREKAHGFGITTYEDRVKTQSPHCKFGETGACCKNCSMGPCRITPKGDRGICGADINAMAARNYIRMIAAGTSAHSDHARELLYILASDKACTKDGPYTVKDEAKLLNLAKEWGVQTDGRDIYEIAHQVGLVGIQEFGKPDGFQRFASRAPQERRNVWVKEGLMPRAIDREIATSMHMTHMGNSAMVEPLIREGMRASLSNGWGGSMLGTEVTDILFGTPQERTIEGNLAVLKEDMVNIVVHGHDPAVSEMIIAATETKEMIDYAKSQGAHGINVVGICCTGNEVAGRHGIPMVGNYMQQENVILTGAVEMMTVDVQCIFPYLPIVAKCFHTKFVTTSPICRIPDAEYMELEPAHAFEQAKELIKEACDNFKNRDKSKVSIPDMKTKATLGYPCEVIIHKLDGVTNSHVDDLGTYKPAVDAIKSGVLRGAVGIVGCNNPRVRPEWTHKHIIERLFQNDVLVVSTGCASQVATKYGLSTLDAKWACGEGLRRVCTLVGIPPILQMGSCVDNTRILRLVAGIAEDWGVTIPELPIVGCAPEWMSEKAVSIANYFISSGTEVFLGIEPQVLGGPLVKDMICGGTRNITGAALTIELDPDKLVDKMLECIEAKRKALGI
jgi:carbon-monoxide dehydrogenase catalytic subunit